MSVPIWRFCLTAGLAGPDRIIGILMPSVDRVGRRFPLTLMSTLPGDGQTLADHLDNDELFTCLEDIALDALDDSASRVGLERALNEVSPPAFDADAASVCGSALALIQSGEDKTGMLIRLAAKLASSHISSLSVWSAVIEGETRLMLCDGLPEGPNMQGLFDFDAPIWTEGLI